MGSRVLRLRLWRPSRRSGGARHSRNKQLNWQIDSVSNRVVNKHVLRRWGDLPTLDLLPRISVVVGSGVNLCQRALNRWVCRIRGTYLLNAELT
jgi:hypothetical protein